MDGDADRCGFGDEHGEFVDQLRVYGLLAMYLLEVRGERGPIVKTLSTTSMLDKLGASSTACRSIRPASASSTSRRR